MRIQISRSFELRILQVGHGAVTRAIGSNRVTLGKHFQREVDSTLQEYLRRRRLDSAAERLRQDDVKAGSRPLVFTVPIASFRFVPLFPIEQARDMARGAHVERWAIRASVIVVSCRSLKAILNLRGSPLRRPAASRLSSFDYPISGTADSPKRDASAAGGHGMFICSY